MLHQLHGYYIIKCEDKYKWGFGDCTEEATEPHFKNVHGGTEENHDTTVTMARLSQNLCPGFPKYKTQIVTAAP
jgi:hypothetical protein